jgi:hypothetical protein
MLTVLIRYNKSRREVLIPAETVEYNPIRKEDGGGLLVVRAGIGSQHLGFSDTGDEDWRDVFVMNDQGQTVARYTL